MALPPLPPGATMGTAVADPPLPAGADSGKHPTAPGLPPPLPKGATTGAAFGPPLPPGASYGGPAPPAIPAGGATIAADPDVYAHLPEMQKAPRALALFHALAPLGLHVSDVTSVISGPHVAHSAHFDGRAIDVGSIGGARVGKNPATMGFLFNAIAHGGLQRIGSTAEIVNDPDLKAFAAAHGVDLFQDEGTGTHLHLQVGAEEHHPLTNPATREADFRNKSMQGAPAAPPPAGARALPPLPPGATMSPAQRAHDALAQGNPMDQPGGAVPEVAARVHSGLGTLAGHQDLMFILHNAQLRDGGERSITDLLRDPKSHTQAAWKLYTTNPGAAMDEYGAGSPAQNAFMAKHFGSTNEGKFAAFMDTHPKTNAAVTLLEEMFNPVAWAEGSVGGRAMGLIGKSTRVTGAAQGAAKAVGMGSPLADIAKRGGVEGSQWAKSLIATVKHEDQLARKQMLTVFDGLSNDEQREVIRLSQGLAPDPQFFGKYVELSKRATALRSDIAKVTSEQVRVGRLKPTTTKTVHTPSPTGGAVIPPKPITVVDKEGNVFNVATYFPMSNAYDFGERAELIDTLRGHSPMAGGGDTASRPKTFQNFDESVASGKLDKDFSPAQNYETWRRQRMQHVAFEDAMGRAPTSLRIPSTPAARKALKAGGGEINGQKYEAVSTILKNANRVLKSPTMRRSIISPELWEYLGENGQFQKYIGMHGSSLPGEAVTPGGRFIGVMRSMIVANPLFHPAVNIAGNDAAARGLHELGGPVFEVGGYGYNSAKALALQAGLVKPEQFVGGAKQYAYWMDRAMKAGAKAEFGTARTSAMGADSARLLTEPIEGGALNPTTWHKRLDKAMSRYSGWNAERTFGDKGEAAFTVSLFKDAVLKGKMTDAQAGQVVREALGDYYNFDPKSPWSIPFLFMPWLKSNMKFWTSVLVKRPQYATGPAHAVRDYNQQQGDPSLDSPFPPPDFRVYLGKDGEKPGMLPEYITPPFVGRDTQRVANIAKGVAEGNPTDVAYQGETLLEGRANVFGRAALNLTHTLARTSDSRPVGPATDFQMIWTPKAPHDVQMQELGRYLIGNGIPAPLVGYAIQDASRRGFNAHDLATAFINAAGLGYGSERLSEDSRRDVSRAQKAYIKEYAQWLDDHDDASLNEAWSTYVDDLKEAGAIH